MGIDTRIMRQIGVLTDLPEATQEALAGIAILVQREAGSMLFFEGDPAPGLYIVQAGRVKIARNSAAGREQVLHIVEPGQHFNTVPVFDNGTCPADASALTDVSLLLLPYHPLRALVERHPSLAMALLAECCGYLRRLVNLVDDLSLTTVQGRLARLLLAQAEAADRREEVEPLTQADMAARLGTVREMVGRTLKTFEGLGIIRIERGAITILDRARLAAEAE